MQKETPVAKSKNQKGITSDKKDNTQTKKLELAREHIGAAVQILNSLDPEFHKVAWMLEDTLMYVDEAAESDYNAQGKPVDISKNFDSSVVTAQSS